MAQQRISRRRALGAGFKSGLEYANALHLANLGVAVRYEPEDCRIHYVQPEKDRAYLPDFILPNGVIIECKGQFTLEDRQKHLWIKQQHPELDIRFVFSNPNEKIRKGSPTTLAKWCDKYGFKWAEKLIPTVWVKEKKT